MHVLESVMLSYLLNSLWQVPLLFGAGWVSARMLRSAGPAAQHRVWAGVVLLQSLLPACSLVSMEWLRGLLPWTGVAAANAAGGVSVVMGAGSTVGILHLPAGFLLVVAIVYGGVFAYFLCRFVWRVRALSVLRLGAAEVMLAGDAAQSWEECSARFDVRDVRLAASSAVFGPVTLGVRRPLVLLPVAMVDSLTREDFQTVIAHECAHMRRRDFLKNLAYEWVSLPVRYHPIFWLTREALIESREMVCDGMAAEVTGRREYAHSLLRLASLLATGAPARTPHAIGIFDANTFERRLMKLTQQQYEVRGVRRFAALVACVALGVATCGSALALRMNVDAAATSGGSKDASTSADPAKVAPEVMAGNILTKVTPHYPEDAKKAKIEGAVQLKAIIGKDGTVENLQVLSGPKELLASSLDAVRQWTYKPYLLNGEPQEIETTITVTYWLRR